MRRRAGDSIPASFDPYWLLAQEKRRPMKRRLVIGFALVLCLVPFALAEATERSEVPAKYKWNLADLYPSEAAWTSARDGITKRIPQMSHFQGRLGVSAESLAIALDHVMKLSEDLQRLYTYSSQ